MVSTNNEFKDKSIILATQGSQGVCVLRELFAIGFKIQNIKIITFDSLANSPFLDFLNFNKKNFTILKQRDDLDAYFLNNSADFLLSVSFRFIFSNNHLSKIKYSAINFHPGLLPFYKGSFSTVWSLINNEKYVGYTFHFMTISVDKGNILLMEKIEVRESDTAHNLNYKIFQKGISQLDSVLRLSLISKGEKQVGNGKFYHNLLPFNGEINRKWAQNKIKQFIKAMYFPPFDYATLKIDGIQYQIPDYQTYKDIIGETDE